MPATRIMSVDAALEFRPTLQATDALIKNLIDDDGNQLSDSLFFSKLQELRREHKRSLKLIEDLYKEKLLEKTAAQRRSHSAIGRRDSETFSHDGLGEEENENGNRQISEGNEDFVRFLNDETRQAYLESRRRGEPPFRLPSAALADSSDQEGQDVESMAGSYISDSYFPQDWENMSLQEVLRSARSALLDSDDEDLDGRAKDVGKRRHSSAMDKKQDSVQAWGQDWKPRITVPVPFRMTIREQTAPIRASYSQNFLHQLLKQEEEKAAIENAKIGRGFRAKPVPASTYLPLYEELLKKNDERRQFVREYSKEMLQQKMKPFSFSNSRNGEHRKRCASADDLRHVDHTDKHFKARPAPEHVLNEAISVELRARELQRQQKKLERAHEMLQNSRWPPNMEAMNYSDIRQALKSRRRHQQQCVANGWTFTPQVTGKVPDFSALHEQFQQALGEAKLKGSRVTVPEPFDLRINSRPRKSRHHEMHKEQVKRHHNAARRSRSMGSLNSTSAEGSKAEKNKKSIVAKPNTAAVLREAAIKRQLNDTNERGRKLLQQGQQRTVEEEKMRERLRSKLIDYDLSRETKERERAEQRKSANQSSRTLYEQFRQSISEKVSDRPSLLDRQSMLIAKQAIDKRYRKALESAGLRGASVATAMSSIEKLLVQDKDAAAAVAAVVESRDSVDSGRSEASHSSVRTSSSSHSSKSSASSSAIAESVSHRSDNTVTVVSKSKSPPDTSSNHSDQEGFQKDKSWSSHHDHTENGDNGNREQRSSTSDVKDILED